MKENVYHRGIEKRRGFPPDESEVTAVVQEENCIGGEILALGALHPLSEDELPMAAVCGLLSE